MGNENRIITMNDFLTNPTGKSSAGFARRDLIIANLGYRFDKLISKYPITTQIYQYEKDSFLFKLRIPSEKYFNRLYYDVVLLFTPLIEKSNASTINNYKMQMYSNSPNFMFTYAYVYNQDDNLVPFLKDKLNKKALTDEPKVKNPQFTYGFEKSVYFALLHLKRGGFNYISKIKNAPKLVNVSAFSSTIKSSDRILDMIDDLKEKARLEKQSKKESKLKEVKNRTTKKPITSSSKNLKRESTNKISNKKVSSFKVSKPKKAKKSLDTRKKK